MNHYYKGLDGWILTDAGTAERMRAFGLEVCESEFTPSVKNPRKTREPYKTLGQAQRESMARKASERTKESKYV